MACRLNTGRLHLSRGGVTGPGMARAQTRAASPSGLQMASDPSSLLRGGVCKADTQAVGCRADVSAPLPPCPYNRPSPLCGVAPEGGVVLQAAPVPHPHWTKAQPALDPTGPLQGHLRIIFRNIISWTNQESGIHCEDYFCTFLSATIWDCAAPLGRPTDPRATASQRTPAGS